MQHDTEDAFTRVLLWATVERDLRRLGAELQAVRRDVERHDRGRETGDLGKAGPPIGIRVGFELAADRLRTLRRHLEALGAVEGGWRAPPAEDPASPQDLAGFVERVRDPAPEDQEGDDPSSPAGPARGGGCGGSPRQAGESDVPRFTGRCVCGERLALASNLDLGIIFWNCFRCFPIFERVAGDRRGDRDPPPRG